LLALLGVWAIWRAPDLRWLEGSTPWLTLFVAATATSSALWALSQFASVAAAGALIWLATLAATWGVLFGRDGLRRLIWPLVLLLLATPIWVLFHAPLWAASTAATTWLVALLGIPMYVVGNTIHLPAGIIQIAAGCAGLGFFATAIAIGAIIAFLNRADLRHSLVLMVLAGLVAMIANWVRITIIVFEAYRTQMQTTLITKDHYTFGWILFAVFLLGYVFLFSRYGQRDPSPASTISAVPKASVLLAGLALALGPALVLADRVLPLPSTVPLAQAMDAEFAGRAQAALEADWRSHFAGSALERQYTWTESGVRLSVYLAAYATQRQGAELISEDNAWAADEHWQVGDSQIGDQFGTVEVEGPDRKVWSVRYLYFVGAGTFQRPRDVQLKLATRALLQRPLAGVLAVAHRCDGRCEAVPAGVVDAVWQRALKVRADAVR
jgi:exosortase